VYPQDSHHRHRAVLELGYLYSRLHLELFGSTGEVHQLVLVGCESRAVCACLGRAFLVRLLQSPTVRFGGSAKGKDVGVVYETDRGCRRSVELWEEGGGKEETEYWQQSRALGDARHGRPDPNLICT
jgi:hypothetical protein